MLPKLLKLNANEAIISGATATSSSGRVTLRNDAHALAPSTRAASISSEGIDCSAPIETRKKYGTVSHVLTTITETFAQFASNSQGTCSPMWPSNLLMTPKSSFISPRHTSSERKPGIAYGRISAERESPGSEERRV